MPREEAREVGERRRLSSTGSSRATPLGLGFIATTLYPTSGSREHLTLRSGGVWRAMGSRGGEQLVVLGGPGGREIGLDKYDYNSMTHI